jgi:hypothetical protein
LAKFLFLASGDSDHQGRVGLGIFKLLVDEAAPQSAADIAKSTGADPVIGMFKS